MAVAAQPASTKTASFLAKENFRVIQISEKSKHNTHITVIKNDFKKVRLVMTRIIHKFIHKKYHGHIQMSARKNARVFIRFPTTKTVFF